MPTAFMSMLPRPCATGLLRPKRLFEVDGTAGGAPSSHCGLEARGGHGLPPATAPSIMPESARGELQGGGSGGGGMAWREAAQMRGNPCARQLEDHGPHELRAAGLPRQYGHLVGGVTEISVTTSEARSSLWIPFVGGASPRHRPPARRAGAALKGQGRCAGSRRSRSG